MDEPAGRAPGVVVGAAGIGMGTVVTRLDPGARAGEAANCGVRTGLFVAPGPPFLYSSDLTLPWSVHR